ncbi:MAG: sugar nucleotide-binding protein, partial [Akkermansiaceae bacterium]|nr:sugar nucleotide-binding protein [Akkermansiaceae bacterium]
ELQNSLRPLGELLLFNRHSLDLSQPETIPAILEPLKPDVIVNAAAYTAVDKAESEPELAHRINAIRVYTLPPRWLLGKRLHCSRLLHIRALHGASRTCEFMRIHLVCVEARSIGCLVPILRRCWLWQHSSQRMLT